VNAFRVEGDPIEYGVELKSIALNNECTLVSIPFRPESQFARTLFWSFLHSTPSPVLLMVQLASTRAIDRQPERNPGARSNSIFGDYFVTANFDIDEDHGPSSYEKGPALFTNQAKDVLPRHRRNTVTNRFQKVDLFGINERKVVILLTNKRNDAVIISLLPRLLENPINQVTFILPADIEQFREEIVSLLHNYRNNTHNQPNLTLLDVSSISTDYDGLFADLNTIPYDLFISSFVDPPEAAAHTSGRTNRSATIVDMFVAPTENIDPMEARMRTGMPSAYVHSDLAYPELGVIGSKIYEKHNKPALVLIVHEPVKVHARSSVISQTTVNSGTVTSPSAVAVELKLSAGRSLNDEEIPV
jgi:hypothetical protein